MRKVLAERLNLSFSNSSRHDRQHVKNFFFILLSNETFKKSVSLSKNMSAKLKIDVDKTCVENLHDLVSNFQKFDVETEIFK